MKKIIIVSLLIIALLVIAGGVFWYWQSQKDVRELNKTLPKGVFAAKSLWGNEYKVVNKIDGYEFKVPEAWEGIKEIEYKDEETILNTRTTGIAIEGLMGSSTVLSLDIYFLSQSEDLLKYSQEIWNFFELEGNLEKIKVGNVEVVKAYEEVHLWGTYVYFWREGNKLYVANNGSEEFIKEIILNGKW